MIALWLMIAAPAASAPSPAFVKGCYERATTDIEREFCKAGEQGVKDDDPVETACFAADYSQQGMNMCAGEAYERADKALNVEWAKIMASDSGEKAEEKLMLDAQRAWIKYRDAHCEASAYSSLGGSIWPMLVSMCKTGLTRQRTRELVEGGEGEGN